MDRDGGNHDVLMVLIDGNHCRHWLILMANLLVVRFWF